MAFLRPKPEQIKSWLTANFDVKPRKGGVEYRICNPFNADSGHHFNINVEQGLAHDWRGDEWAGGGRKTFLRFVQLYRGCTYLEAVREVCGQNVTIDSIYTRITKKKVEECDAREYDIRLPDGSLCLADHLDSTIGRMLAGWLGSRGINKDMIKLYNLHFHTMNVVWPYYEYGSLVYWQQRNRLNKTFAFPPESVGVTKSMFIYGFDMVEPMDYLIINEAIFDSITLGDQATASGGAILAPMQIQKIRSLNPIKGIILAPDNDIAGIKSMISNYKLLCPYYPIFFSIPPAIPYEETVTKDWNDLGKVMPWRDIRPLFESLIKPLTPVEIAAYSRMVFGKS